MIMRETLNIDDLPPVEITKQLKQHEKWRKAGYCVNQRCRDGHRNVGLSYKKLYDWRKLETRANELFERLNSYSSEFWTFLRESQKIAKMRGAKEVWVISPNDERVIVYDEGGMTTQRKTSLIDDSIKEKDPNKKALIVDGDVAKNVYRLYEREHVTLKRFHVFEHAFRKAVELRLRPFIDEKLHRRNHNSSWYDCATFFIENNTRMYTVSSTIYGQFEWKERTNRIYCCV